MNMLKKLIYQRIIQEKRLYFLYNGAKLDFKSKRTIGNMFRNNTSITVFDQGGVIDLWIINFNSNSGVKISMKINQSQTIKNMMEEYVERIKVPKEAIGKTIIFLYCGQK